MIAPLASLKKTGVPPTDLKARTGELTPPGINNCALSKRSLLVFINCFLHLLQMQEFISRLQAFNFSLTDVQYLSQNN